MNAFATDRSDFDHRIDRDHQTSKSDEIPTLWPTVWAHMAQRTFNQLIHTGDTVGSTWRGIGPWVF